MDQSVTECAINLIFKAIVPNSRNYIHGTRSIYLIIWRHQTVASRGGIDRICLWQHMGLVILFLFFFSQTLRIPVLTREFYGEKYWGTNLAILGLGSALGSFLFATEMAGRIYQSHVAPGSLDCFGTGCFQMTFWIGAACCVVAALLSLVLYARSRGLYQLIFRLRPTPPKKSIQ